jgi:hypothetical protein
MEVKMMTDYSSADLCKLTLQEVADLLLEKLEDDDHTRSSCKVYGCSVGRMFELRLVMKEVKE